MNSFFFTDAIPPTVKSLGSTPEFAIVEQPVVITCEAIAVPLPSYIIMHNDTEVVSTQNTYIIRSFKNIYAGSYKCIATNYLGNSSKILNMCHASKYTRVQRNFFETLKSDQFYVRSFVILPGTGGVLRFCSSMNANIAFSLR